MMGEWREVRKKGGARCSVSPSTRTSDTHGRDLSPRNRPTEWVNPYPIVIHVTG